MSSIKVNKIIPNTLSSVVIEGNVNFGGNINSFNINELTGMTATTVVKTPQVITKNVKVDSNTNALIIGPDIRLAPGTEMRIGQNSVLHIFDPILFSSGSTSGAGVSMTFALSWQKPSDNFEFIFNPFKWGNIGNPFIGNKPWSQDINPATNNTYEIDYDNFLKIFMPGCRITWMDEDTSKWFDWNYTYVNPFTLQNQTWEPKGMIVTQTSSSNNSWIPFPSWINSTNYIVGDKVTYNGYIWKCNISNSNQIPTTTIPNPFPNTDYWLNTGVPSTSGPRVPVPNSLKNFFEFNAMASLNDSNSQWIFAGGGPGGGTVDGIYMAHGYSARLSPTIPGKMPIVTLNVFLNPTNSNRFPTPFNVQHQMNMLNYINTGMGLNPNTLPKVDIINLGSNLYNRQGCDLNPLINPFVGYTYGAAMVDYVTQIRANSEPITANAKIVMQATNKSTVSSSQIIYSRWAYDHTNPLNTNEGFIHGFYSTQTGSTATTVDFDIISLQTAIDTAEAGTNYSNAQTNFTPISWAYNMGGHQYIKMRDTVSDCKTALSLYGKQNRIKYWYRYLSHTINPMPVGYSKNNTNYSWATQTGVFMAMALAATDPDFEGFQYNSIINYNDCNVNLVYNSTDTFGPNTTRVMDLTSVGWMFKRFLKYFQPEYGALSYTRILKSGGLGLSSPNYGYDALDYIMGIYINSSGINGTPQHTIILCNYDNLWTRSIDIDTSQLIDPNWTDVRFSKIYTPTHAYNPINHYFPPLGVWYHAQESAPYTPTQAEILSTPLTPQEYLLITAYS